MENLKIVLENQEYNVSRNAENSNLFTVLHQYGTHVIFRKSKGNWDYYEHKAGSLPIPFDHVGKMIDQQL